MSEYKIYPPIGIARVGNAPDAFYIGPEKYRGLPTNLNGNPFKQNNFRDEENRLCRQAARFHIFHGDDEITLKTPGVKSIIWTVHVANKKASWYEFATNEGEHGYASNHPLRNPHETNRQSLIIDPGPREIRGANAGPVPMDKNTIPRDYNGANFPAEALYPTNEKIDTLGELRTDAEGRLLVLGGLGISGTKYNPPQIKHYANNDEWWDDTSDGPVSAVIEWEKGGNERADTAWVIVAPPSYAPEIANLVTLWDTIFDSAVRAGNYPKIYDKGIWQSGAGGYKPNFQSEIKPLLERASAYTWVAAIPSKPHDFDSEMLKMLGVVPGKNDLYSGLRNWILDILRPPSNENTFVSERGATMMPYLAGDNCLLDDTLTSNFLRLTDTQFFFVQQWAAGHFLNKPVAGQGPLVLTRNVLDNCVGGAFSPGIELTWISRNRYIYSREDHFRINAAPSTKGPLSLGFNPSAMEPGDLTRYMAIPWQADFNECSSQPIGDRVLWWWPAQRPEFVYLEPAQRKGLQAIPTPDENTKGQVAWVGTDFDQLRGDFISFADDVQMVKYWSKLGFVMEKTIRGEQRFVEVERTLPPRPFIPPNND